MTAQHASLAAGRWSELPFLEQMANVGSEVERALHWRAKQRADYAERAIERALELLDLTLANARTLSRLKELARVREALVEEFFGTRAAVSTEESWKRYFLAFAYAARRTR
jgi:hypothetical protein